MLAYGCIKLIGRVFFLFFSGEKNYTVCFVFFCLFMLCAFIAATRFTFIYDGMKENIQLGELKNQIWKKAKKAGEIVTRPTGFGRQRLEEDDDYDDYPSTGYDTGTGKSDGYSGYGSSHYSKADEKRDPEKTVKITLQGENGIVGSGGIAAGRAVQDVSDHKGTIISTHVPRGEPGRSGTLPEMMTVLKMFGKIHYGAMLYLTWFMGFGVGLMFTFLFWHLQVCKETIS